MLLVKIYFCIFSRFNAIFPAARDPNFQAEEEDISTRDDHGAGVPEWTPAGVCILGWSRSQGQY